MNLDYVIQELEGRKQEISEGIEQSQAKMRESEMNLKATKKREEEMISIYQNKILELNEALAILREQQA